MNHRYPFIKKFKTAQYNYIYDVHSNEIIRVAPLIYDIIDYINEDNTKPVIDKFKHKYSAGDISNNFETIKKVQSEHNCFSPQRPGIYSGFSSEDDVKYMLNTGISQLILNATSRCNNRCKYCFTSGRYYHSRKHGQKDMPLEIARKAVDFFIEKSRVNREKNTPAITIYGGEPILRFDLIQKTVELTKSKGVFEKYNFSFTTNGTLLNEDSIKYLVKNNISILISIDGPPRIHDRYRVFRNGRGTFNVIIKNLKRIQEYSRKYFENNITLNAVIAPPYDFDTIIDFFFGEKFMEPLKYKLSINFVNAYETTFFKDFKLQKEYENLQKELNRLKDRYKKALINGTYDDLTIEQQLFLKDFYNIERRPIKNLDDRFPPLGTCIPGKRRLFVDTYGKFFMCEKVGRYYEIGNVYDGFDYKRIYNFYVEYDRFFKKCEDCWAVRLCRKCFNNIRKGENFYERRKEKLCEIMVKKIEENLSIYCEIIEENPDAFKIFENVTMS
jgi:uncharacterized protein